MNLKMVPYIMEILQGGQWHDKVYIRKFTQYPWVEYYQSNFRGRDLSYLSVPYFTPKLNLGDLQMFE